MRPAILLTFALTACFADETVAGYATDGAVYRLVELNGAPFEASATMTFGDNGAISGDAPCNGYSGRQSAPYPWFELGPLRATKRACPDLEAENTFFRTLSQMTQAEVSGPILILSGEDGDVMMFDAR